MATGTLLRRALSITVLVSFLGMTTACYGPFNLTRTLHKWNGQVGKAGEIDAKWMQELVFLPLALFQIYTFAALGDAIVFNSIQFWTGDNPIKLTDEGGDGRTKVAQVGDVTVTMTVASDNASARATYVKDGQVFRTAEIVRDGDRYRVLDGNGRHLYSGEVTAAGGLNIVNDECQLLEAISGEQLALTADRLAAAQVAAN